MEKKKDDGVGNFVLLFSDGSNQSLGQMPKSSAKNLARRAAEKDPGVDLRDRQPGMGAVEVDFRS
jgi:hypothetical protein